MAASDARPTAPATDPAGEAATRRSESAYFDGLIADAGAFDPFLPRGWQTLRHGFERLVQPATGLRLLDVGCGTGAARQVYAGHAGSYVGIDLSRNALRTAASPGQDGTAGVSLGWAQADACHLPFADGTFDGVCFSSVLHHVPDYLPALREAHRALRPGGFAFAFDPNLFHPAMALLRHPRSPLYTPKGVSPNERPLRPGALRRTFAEAGFVDVRQTALFGIPYRSVAPRGVSAFLKVYNGADRLMQHTGLGRWFGTFVLTAGRRAG